MLAPQMDDLFPDSNLQSDGTVVGSPVIASIEKVHVSFSLLCLHVCGTLSIYSVRRQDGNNFTEI